MSFLHDVIQSPFVAAILAGFSALGTPIVAYLLGKKRTDQVKDAEIAELKSREAHSTARAAQIVSDAATDLIRPLTERVSQLNTQVAELVDENARLKTANTLLKAEQAIYAKEKEILEE